MIPRKFWNRFVALCLITLATVYTGCERDISAIAAPAEEATPANVIQTNEGPMQLLTVDPNLVATEALHKGDNDTVFRASRWIEAEKGGWITVGDWSHGFSTIHFGQNELPKSDTIHFEWTPQATFEGLLTGMEFGPHGTEFNGPVFVSLSYKMADLDGVDLDGLRVVYLNDETGEWEVQATHVNKWFKTVTVYLNHFSRYALAHGYR